MKVMETPEGVATALTQKLMGILINEQTKLYNVNCS